MKPAKPFNAPSAGAGLGVLVTIVLAFWVFRTPSTADGEGCRYSIDQRIYGSIVAALMMVIPSVIAGGSIGLLAERLRTHPSWLRRVAIVGVACLTVLGLGALMGLSAYVPRACVPVVVAALYMEHRTRASAPIPVAIASKVR
ncbi:MAG TPA: hypothetical protein VF403_03080 [Kofleriaceae bacterium]